MKRVAVVVFTAAFDDDPKKYHYFTDIGDLKTGDYCVVDSGPGLGIVEIKGFHPDTTRASNWIVQKIDMEAYKERRKRQERIDTLYAQLEARRKKFEKEHLWSMIAEKDLKAKDLLAELSNLEDN